MLLLGTLLFTLCFGQSIIQDVTISGTGCAAGLCNSTTPKIVNAIAYFTTSNCSAMCGTSALNPTGWSVNRTCPSVLPTLTGVVANLYSDANCTNLVGTASVPTGCVAMTNAAPYVSAQAVCGPSSSAVFLYTEANCAGAGTSNQSVTGLPTFPAQGSCVPVSMTLPSVGSFSGFGKVTCATSSTCYCGCCTGNNCAVSTVGNMSVSSCDTCTSTACSTAFPSQCTPGAGVVVNVCGSEGGLIQGCVTATSVTCFHESTLISFGKKQYSLRQIAELAYCHIPHVVQTSGVSLWTSCGGDPLRLTLDHLVFTSEGLRAAGSLKEGDILFGNIEETRFCKILQVLQETNQRYFGLNCHESVVLANSIKTSTFGNYHVIPAFWMKWAGRILGIERASRWGDSIASLCARARLI